MTVIDHDGYSLPSPVTVHSSGSDTDDAAASETPALPAPASPMVPTCSLPTSPQASPRTPPSPAPKTPSWMHAVPTTPDDLRVTSPRFCAADYTSPSYAASAEPQESDSPRRTKMPRLAGSDCGTATLSGTAHGGTVHGGTAGPCTANGTAHGGTAGPRTASGTAFVLSRWWNICECTECDTAGPGTASGTAPSAAGSVGPGTASGRAPGGTADGTAHGGAAGPGTARAVQGAFTASTSTEERVMTEQ